MFKFKPPQPIIIKREGITSLTLEKGVSCVSILDFQMFGTGFGYESQEVHIVDGSGKVIQKFYLMKKIKRIKCTKKS